jgi:hypothetical protein
MNAKSWSLKKELQKEEPREILSLRVLAGY